MIANYRSCDVALLDLSKEDGVAARGIANDLAVVNRKTDGVRTIFARDGLTPLAVVGIGEIEPGVVAVFSITGERARHEHKLTFYRDLRALLGQARERYAGKKIRALGKFSARLQRHFGALGFVFDCDAPDFPGQGYWRMLGA